MRRAMAAPSMKALHNLGDRAKRKLILTATPFSIRLTELEQLLQVRRRERARRHDVTVESKRLVSAARAAIDVLQPYVIRHCIDDLSASERMHFGATSAGSIWGRRSIAQRSGRPMTPTTPCSGTSTRRKSRSAPAGPSHPKIAAVSDAIRPLLDAGEKVLVFCHHRATASELLSALERCLRAESVSRRKAPEKVWRAAWKSLLPDEDYLVTPIIDWLCTPGLRRQVGGWISEPAGSVEAVADQLAKIRPCNASSRVATIFEAAKTLTEALLDTQSTPTRALLRPSRRASTLSAARSRTSPDSSTTAFVPMGTWDYDGHAERPETLYTGKPDVVLAIFNSPFGPDMLVTTDRLSEGVDLHRCCRHLIHYELDPSPVRTLQRNGRVRRVGSWAAITSQPICYAYPTFGGTRDGASTARDFPGHYGTK